MKSCQSNDELFRVVEELMARLAATGFAAEAAELKSGYQLLNGLTDGWALFLESINRVENSDRRLPADDRATLKSIRAAVHALVYR